MAIDPVCKMQVDPETASAKTEYQSQAYTLCCPGCNTSFERDPVKYLEATEGGQMHHHEHWEWSPFSAAEGKTLCQ